MSQLTIYANNNPSNALVNTRDLSEITQQLAKVNVRFMTSFEFFILK